MFVNRHKKFIKTFEIFLMFFKVYDHFLLRENFYVCFFFLKKLCCTRRIIYLPPFFMIKFYLYSLKLRLLYILRDLTDGENSKRTPATNFNTLFIVFLSKSIHDNF